MKLDKKILFSFVLIFITIQMYAQFSVDLDMRSRAGYWNGYKTLPTSETNAATLISQRSRINFNYTNDNLSARVSLQDARVWGQNNNDFNSIHEAWINYNFNKSLSVKIGRQTLSYDNKRLLAKSNWNLRDISHDVALVMYKKNDFQAHLGYAVYNNGAPASKFLEVYQGGKYDTKELAFLWLKHSFLEKKLNVSFMSIVDGTQQIENEITNPEQVNYRYTVGPYIKYQQDKIMLSVQYYHQAGTTAFDNDISANLFGAVAKYSFSKTFNLSTGYDFLSGTDYDANNTSTENNTFCKLFGSGHGFFGYLDYFGTPSAHGAGLSDIFIRAQGKLPYKLSYQLTYHNFSLDQEYLKLGEKVDKGLGSEIDLTICHKLADNATIMVGYSTFFATESMEILKNVGADNSEMPSFLYLQLNFTPNIFKQ